MTYTAGEQVSAANRRVPHSPSCNNLLARIVVIGSIVLSVFGIILYSYDLYRHGGRQHLIGWFSSAGFVLLTFAISIRLIVLHLTHWYSPAIQKWLVRIIWMVPIYSIESWLALRFRDQAIYIETVRECYEAYAIFSFLYFLIALLGEEAALIAILKDKNDERGEHVFPLRCCVKPWTMGPEFLHHSKLGVLQYVLMKNLMAALIFILQIFDLYAEGRFRFDRGYIYICLISNLSQLWALYCLIKFYQATKEELAPWAPFGKFMCVKVVVFFTWWQSLFVSFVAASLQVTGSNGPAGDWSREQIVMGFQDWLICIEMFIASIAFSVSFTYNDYVPKHKDDEEREEGRPFLSALIQSSLPDDIFGDIRRVAHGQELSVRSSSRKIYDSGEESGSPARENKIISSSSSDKHDGKHDNNNSKHENNHDSNNNNNNSNNNNKHDTKHDSKQDREKDDNKAPITGEVMRGVLVRQESVNLQTPRSSNEKVIVSSTT